MQLKKERDGRAFQRTLVCLVYKLAWAALYVDSRVTDEQPKRQTKRALDLFPENIYNIVYIRGWMGVSCPAVPVPNT